MQNQAPSIFETIENKIYLVRGVYVMLDSDLAALYKVETKNLNKTVKRNLSRFPEQFMFQIILQEWETLSADSSRFQFGTMKNGNDTKLGFTAVNKNNRGHNLKYLPHLFTEQGVAMLSAVLKSETAISVSIQIMAAFVDMRKTINQSQGLIQRIESVEKKQLVADDKFERIFSALEQSVPIPTQGIFFNGQIFDAYKFVSEIIKTAKHSIILIDNYIDESTLAILSKRNANVNAIIYTADTNKILPIDLHKYNHQYQPISIKTLKNNHDRFLIIDKKEMYHIGASLKDLGKKIFAFSKMDHEVGTILGILF